MTQSGTPRLTGKAFQETVARYNAFFSELQRCFVHREELIRFLKYGLIQKQHVLVFGPPGTSKTALFNKLTSRVNGSKIFKIELNMFMDDTALNGPYNSKVMREEGRLEHNIAGMLPEADIARLGEFLDANLPLLRSLLSELNERVLERGSQVVDLPLVTAYCDTNVEPGQYLKRNEQAFAVLDRFLYMTYVDYLDSESDITTMIKGFQNGSMHSFSGELRLQDIRELSRLTLEFPSMIRDESLFRAMGSIFHQYRVKREKLIGSGKATVIFPKISDRRLCLATQTAEVTAILAAREYVLPEDLYSMELALCSSAEERELLKSIVDAELKKLEKEREAEMNDAHCIALNGLISRINCFSVGIISDVNGIRELSQALDEIDAELSKLKPESDTAKGMERNLRAKLSEMRTKAEEKALGLAGLKKGG